MRRLWKDATRPERIFIVVHILLLLACIGVSGLYFLGIPWHIVRTFVWCLFVPIFFTRACIYLRTDRDRAGMDILSGSIASIVTLIGFLAYLMTL